jgi:hypothetical protein
MPREQDELPMDFSVPYFKPGNAWRRATVGPGHATGIEKQNATASFITRDMCVAVQENIDIIWQSIGRNVLQTEFQPVSHTIDNQRPLEIAVAISAHKRNARSDRPQFIKNRFRANITKMPDFIGILGHFDHIIRQTIVRVRKDEDA